MTTPSTEALVDGDLSLEPTSGSDEFIGFSVVVEGARVGTLAFRREGRTTLSVRWNVGEQSMRLALRALGLAVPHAFGVLGATRLEARIPVDRTDDVRAASISGLRREGIVRGAGTEPDRVLMARLVDDPEPRSRDGFIAILNAGLPTKRVISQGLLRDTDGRVLLCELTYKDEWDLPGGVIEVGESPAVGLQRELFEELGVTVEVGDLVTIDWLPPWRGWDDACVFLFDLGTVDASWINDLVLQPTEIRGVHWCDPATVADRATAIATELLTAIDAGGVSGYREAPQG